ncbi:MAG TPA: aminotransferase class I/II-fold pyridoxal phosphate-dependent enzyme [Anaerolineales bacterium]|nr:aminotransferase class I/II-fold pyridoxal phosphate-dependent enzyme [Anaerolineales bacterium]HMX74293.1 aminotransferase class I/II-fold pyridoxal phosphate-dependent enzyme [Anaerolineales bacterium]HNE67356.1 aminotransferase class I/II-fold pyridoxal phosphate-dependent enzyme [Anaerolineales bacterium]HNH79668.1 aminotransferase class I/II-fold pyridoxal phosphate-dependent enzyme [Anaerolineales bacterium]HNJ12796.1 aminotransferase class I/II-fold pyridoxal phosphate-dependent enzym
MDFNNTNDAVTRRIKAMTDRLDYLKSNDLYFYNQPVEEILPGNKVRVRGREMGMYASYSYLGLVGHPRINEAAKKAVEKFGTGTNGVRTLAGTLTIHSELEETISNFKHTEAAITYTSGYATNLTVISTLMGRGDYVFSDKINHASIVDGCLMSGAEFRRFRHNDMEHLEGLLKNAPADVAKLVIADSVFSMDGDIIDLPTMVTLCKKYNAWLMIDEAHSVGVLGEKGTGIEEYFNMYGEIDIKMGTLSKTIPSVGGYVAARKEIIQYLRHASRAYIFSAALPPAQAAAANEAFKVILDEPWRIERLNQNTKQFIGGLKSMGFDTLLTETAIVPVLCGEDDMAFAMTRECQHNDVFVLPVVSPAVQEGLARLRATVTAAHEPSEIERAMDVIGEAGKKLGLLK